MKFKYSYFCLFSGLIADQTGNYVYSFYMTGGVLIAAFLIPLILICVNRGRSRVHTMDTKEFEQLVAIRKLSKGIQTMEPSFKEFAGLKKLRLRNEIRKRSSSAII